jgi:endo-1,4-beta-xylanase
MSHRHLSAALAASLCLTACSRATTPASASATSAAQGQGLKDKFRSAFLVGAALAPKQFEEQDVANAALVKREFNTISPENVLKWVIVHPQPNQYDFAPADKYVAFGERNGMFIIGHTLVWHSQVPAWVFQDAQGQPLTRDALLARMKEHISTVVGHYKGRIKGWDVVNEALNEDGSLRETPWMKIIGPDYIQKAFEYAHEADPAAELYYNDYNLDYAAKRDGAVRLVKSLLDRGIPVHAIGSQEHLKLTTPTATEVDAAIRAFAAIGVKVNMTELDIDLLPPATRNTGADVSQRAGAAPSLNPYAAGLPDSMQLKLARRYEDLFRVYLANKDAIDRVTFWGVADGDSWLNGWPVPGRTSYPLLFDRQLGKKPAYDAVSALANASRIVP